MEQSNSKPFEQQNVQVINNYHSSGEKINIKGARNVNEKLRKIIDAVKVKAGPPDTDIIDFMNELRDRVQRNVMLVPVEQLKFRKNNGRIIADVESYERETGRTLEEDADETQNVLRRFLANNDRERNDELKRLLAQKGQRSPAIITCDGFLINGNRRKMALEELYRETNENPRFQTMRVVILPEGVSELEIQKIENRYQLQSEGKSEYQGLNRAIKYKRNMDSGFSLEAQLRDDPNYHELAPVQFKRVVKDFEKNFIHPLSCIDRYLGSLGRDGMYTTISENMNDREGRWQAFVEYSHFCNGTLKNNARLAQLDLKKEDIEKLEAAVFKIIRKRSLNSRSGESPVGKLSEFIRRLPKFVSNSDARDYILKIADIPSDIPEEMMTDKDGNACTEREIDSKWGAYYEKEILGNLFLAQRSVTNQETRDKPLELLEDALKKLNHNNLKIGNMGSEYYEKGLELMETIRQKAEEIHKAIDHARFDYKRSGRN